MLKKCAYSMEYEKFCREKILDFLQDSQPESGNF